MILILRDLFTGTNYFLELKKSLNGVSQKVLTANLRSLEEKGIIEREVSPEVPPRVEYKLTDLGKTLDPIIKSMHDWGEFYKSIFLKRSIFTHNELRYFFLIIYTLESI